MANYIPKVPSEYSDAQIILDSERLIFNAKKDSIFLFSKESIGLASKGTLNVDVDKYFIVNSPKNYLGINSVDEEEPAVLGGQLKDFFDDLLQLLQDLADNIKDCETSAEGGKLIPLNMAGVNIELRLDELKRFMPNIFSKITFLE